VNEKFLKPYNPAETEPRIYEKWLESGFFNPDNLPGKRTTPFTIIMPPPNANGSLHAGHALFITIQDIMIRYRRMRGDKALWVPGADHAGFETQVVYEKKLEKEGRSRFGMDPKQLYKEIYDFTIENKKIMEDQVKTLGASCDWSREKFTLDPEVVSEVQKTFVKMHDDNLIYRGKRTINWCPKHQTSLSDVETENVEEKTPFFYFKYGPFTIGTVRPETKFGDKYVVMHPNDKRYAKYKHGDTLEVEWINGKITATVIKDEAVDMEFGSGVMTITPWHSQIDFEIATRHNLDMEQIIDWRGKLLPIAGEFAGVNIKDARPKIVEKLKAKGLLEKVDENYTNVVKRCYKCNTSIEPQIKDQWFVKMKPLAEKALEAVEKKEVVFIPNNYEKIFRYWMENTLDWNISRQIVWGIQIPAWFKNRGSESEKIKISLQSPGEGFEQDPDTFDTWFSSGQWPLLALNYPSGADFKTFYPTDVMETGHDLIFKWVPRMVIFGLYLAKKAPFRTVYLHGLVNDAKGKKMSKSKGNVINPLDLTEKYGTDALRIGLVVGNTPGTSLALSEDKIRAYKNFANKLWNIARFVLENTEGVNIKDGFPERNEHDEKLRLERRSILEDVTKDMEEYRFYLAAEKLYHYTWHTFADKILEESKTVFADGSDEAKVRRKQFLLHTLDALLKALHPFMPFVTEEIWQVMYKGEKMLMVEKWPVGGHIE